MNPLIYAIILSILPISELRGGIPFAIANGVDPWTAFFVCVIANILIIPVLFLFLDYLHKHFMKIGIYRKVVDGAIRRGRRKMERHIGTKWEFIILFLFVGIPAPVTGGYTGTLISWVFKLKRRKSYLAIFCGIAMAGVLMTLASIGIFSLF